MTHIDPPEYDVLGIGLGPSNLALAIAFDDMGRERGVPLCAHFVERQPRFVWHGGMLLPDAEMQISFLKDLVSLRDPTSPLTFVNYLHKKGRLEDFANCRTFYPSRIEFNDYLAWVAETFAEQTTYGEEIVAVEPLGARDVVHALRVVSRTASAQTRIRHARRIVVSVGGVPHVPPVFSPLRDHPRLLHSSRYLDSIDGFHTERPLRRIAVIGGGQSATEITMDLHKRLPDASVDLIFRGHALKPSDSSPFVNEIFHPVQTDVFHGLSEAQRGEIVATFRNTNYAVVTDGILVALHKALYQQKVEGRTNIALHPRRQITAVDRSGDAIAVTTADRFTGHECREAYDAIILATGYERSSRQPFLDPLAPFMEGSEVDRLYRMPMQRGFEPTIFMQGYSEASHGISDTLLSVVAVRSAEIARAIFDELADRGTSPRQYVTLRAQTSC